MKISTILAAAFVLTLTPLPASAKEPAKAPTKTFDLTKVIPCPPQSNIARGEGPDCKQDPEAQKADYQGVLDARKSANDDEIAMAMADAAYPTVAQFLRPIWLRLVNTAPDSCAPAKAILADLDHDAAIAAQGRLKEDEATLNTSLPATMSVLNEVNYAEYRASDKAKDIYNRTRPFATTIPGLPPIEPLADKAYQKHLAKSSPSYPSGHTTFAFTEAAVLSALLPGEKTVLMNRAERYGWHRLVVGVHFPTDVAAGKQSGLLVADAYLKDGAMKPRLDAAAAELRKALCY